MYILDDDNKPIHFETVEDGLEDYFQWRLPFYQKMKNIELARMKSSVLLCQDKVKFINAVIDGDLVLVKGNGTTRKTDEIMEDIRRLELNEKLYGEFSKYDRESVKLLKLKCEKTLEEYEILKNTSKEQMWENDLFDIFDAYIKNIGDDRRGKKVMIKR